MPRLRGSPRGVTIPRRLTSWESGPGGTAVASTSVGTAIILGSAISATVPGLTIVRLRGELMMYMDQAASSNDGFAGAFGIGLASKAAVTVGVGSVPTPIAEDTSENWLYHRYFALKAGFGFAGGADPGGNNQFSLRIDVDSKAMRKFPEDLSIYAAIEVVEVGVASLQMHFDSRTLVKLP